jgi:tRNA (guanine-N7-)-methyltransferase
VASPENLVYELPSILDRLDFARLFPKLRPVEIELGCGDGSFLIDHAAGSPERNFLGVERLLGRIRKVDRKGRRLGLNNVRAVRIEASYFLEFLLPPASVEAVHIYFPDPWPKARHERHRLIQPGFPHLVHRALRPGGRVFLRTDDPDYRDRMIEVFERDTRFRATDTPEPLAAIWTDFERDFHLAGRPIFRVAFQMG